MQEPKKPIGDFIINNSKGTQTENGVYYHYTEVCRLLKLYEKQLLIHSVVLQSEQLRSTCDWCNGNNSPHTDNDYGISEKIGMNT